MTDYSTIDFDSLVALAGDDEVVTHSYVRDIPLSGGKTLALITLDNGRDHTRPNTLGAATLLEYAKVLDELKARAAAGEIHAVAVTGKPFILAAGADLSKVAEIPDKETAKKFVQLGHYALGKLTDVGVPSFVFYNGLALGGGLEIGLHADYRTVDASAPALALPEVFLGLIPGWGGATILPNLIGIENALKVVIENPLKQNRTLKGQDAFDLGIADAIFPSVNYLEDSHPVGRRRDLRTRQGQASERARQGRAPRQVGCRHRHRHEDAEEPHRLGPAVPVRRARPHEGRQERHPRRGLPARGRGARRPHRGRPAPGIRLRLQPRAEAHEAAGRRTRQGRSRRRSPRSA